MTPQKIQNTICRSRMLLPCSCAVAVALWCLPMVDNWHEREQWQDRAIGLAICMLIAYVLTEMCNSNSLIRVYTRSVSSFFIVSVACMGFLHNWQPSTIAALCLVAGEYIILKADMRKSQITDTFHIFLSLGLGSLFVPQLAVFVPFHYWSIILMSRRFSLRAFWAGVIGLALPLLVAVGICHTMGRMDIPMEWYAKIITIHPLASSNYLSIDEPVALCWAMLLLLTLWCGIYFWGNMYRDKPRVRTLFRVIYMQTLVIAALAALQPQHACALLPAMMVSTAPIAAHYFTLSDTRVCTVVFSLTLLMLCGVALLTLTDTNITITDIIATITN